MSFLTNLFAPAGAAIAAAGLAAKVAAGEQPVVIDVREPSEFAGGHVPGSRNVPLGQLAQRLNDIPRSGPVYLVCRSGARSAAAARQLAGHGCEAFNVTGGMMAYPGPVNR